MTPSLAHRVTTAAAVIITAVSVVAHPAPAVAQKAAVVVSAPEERRESRSLVDDLARKRIVLQRWTVAETGPLTTTEVREMVTCLAARRPATGGAASPPAAPTAGSAAPAGTRDCASVLVSQVVADRLLILSVVPEGRRSEDTVVTAWLLDGRGDLLATTGQRCDRCRPILLQQVTSDVFATVWRDARAQSGRGTLQIRSIPAGAAIDLDGKPAGTTDADLDVLPGRHQIVLRKDGFEPATRAIEVGAGASVPVPVELVPVGTTIPEDGPSEVAARRPILLPAIAGGVGVAALVTGAIFIGIDEDATPQGPIGPTYRDSAPSGYAVGAVGLVAVGAAVAWYFLQPMPETPAQRGGVARPARPIRWAPSAASIGGGWSVGVAGDF